MVFTNIQYCMRVSVLNLTPTTYTDDTTLVFSGNSNSFLEPNTTEELNNPVQLFNQGNLKKNSSKSNYSVDFSYCAKCVLDVM